MADTSQSGVSLGTAKATILLVADKFAQGAKVVQSASLAASRAVDGLNASFDRAGKAARAFDNSPLGKLQQNLKGIRDQLVLVSAAAAAVGAVGIKAAQDFATTRKSIELLTGSTRQAEKVFADVRKLTDKFNVPFDEAIKGAQAFLPLAKTTGVAVDELVKSAIRFQAYNPRKSFDEIKFSINEALSGDFVSIKDTLDLSRKQRDELKKALEEEGPQKLLEGLNDILIERGFTDESLIELGESGANAFAQLQSEIKETMATAFEPLLKDFVLPTVKSIGEFLRNLRETNPDVLKFGAGITAIVVAGAPLLTFLTTAIGLFRTLKTVTAALDLGKTVSQVGEAAAGAGRLRDAQGRFLPAGQGAPPDASGAAGAASVASKGAFAGAGVIAAGVVSGVGVGVVGAKVLADRGVRTGDLGRVAEGENPLTILAQRIVQGLVVISTAFVGKLTEFLNTFLKALATVKSAIEQFVNVFKLGGAILGEAFGNLRIMFGKFIQAIGSLLASIPGQEIRGQEIIGTGLAEQMAGGEQTTVSSIERRRLMEELAKGVQPSQEDIANIDKATQDIRDSIVGVYFDIYDTLYPLPEQVKPIFDNTSKVVREGVEKVAGESEEYLEQQAKEIADATQSYNDDLIALETKKQTDIIELNKRYADEQIQIAQDRVKAERAALEGLQEDLRKFDMDLTRETEKEGRERGRKNIEMQIKFQRQELEDAESHVATLERIRKDAQKKEQAALENFDFAALFDLSEEVKEQTDAANSEYDAQRRERVQALQYERDDMVREFGAQREERLIQYEQDRADRQAQYETERARIGVEAQERLALAAQTHASEMAQLTNKHTAELSLRQQAYTAELNLLMQTEQQRLAIMAQTQEALLQQAYSLMNRVRPGSSGGAVSTRDYGAGTSQQRIAETQQRSRIEQDARNNELASQGRRVSGYAYGGYPTGPAIVNEPRTGFDAESIVRGMQSFRLPNGLGLFTPLTQGVQVKPNASGGSGTQTLTVHVHLNAPINTALPLDEAVALIQQTTQETLDDWMTSYQR